MDKLTTQTINLTKEQDTAINTTEGIVCLSAGPGCGKTFVLVNRYLSILKKLTENGISHSDALHKILAVTFTRKAAFQMQERISKEIEDFERIKHNIRISTIDAWASAFLKEVAIKVGFDPDFELIDTTFAKSKFLDIAQKMFDSYDVKDMELPKRPQQLFEDIFHFTGQLKSRLITPDFFLETTKQILLKEETSLEIFNLAKFIKELYEIFDDWMRKNNYMVFSDLLFRTHEIFTQHPEILKDYAKQIEYILIDEYQDLNDAQDKILRMLSKATNDQENYFLVGDIGQSIYGFRDANYRNMFEYKKSKAEFSLELSQNFRSTKNIVKFVNKFFNENIYQKLVIANNAAAADKIKILLAETIDDEAKNMANQVQSLLSQGYEYNDIKILLRSMTNVWIYADALESLGIPVVVLGSSEFGKRKETSDILSIFRVIHNKDDEEAKVRLLSSEIFGFDFYELAIIKRLKMDEKLAKNLAKDPAKKLAKYEKLITDFKEKSEAMRPLELFEYILKKLEYIKYIHTLKKSDYHRHLDTIEKFRILLRQYEREIFFYSIGGFLEFFANVESEKFSLFANDEIVKYDAIAIMTVHAAKGLEFPVVFVGGGKIPNRKNLLHFHDKKGFLVKDTKYFKEFLEDKLNEDFKEEEERIFYVANTRAKEKLFLASYKSYGKYNSFIQKVLDNEQQFAGIIEIIEDLQSAEINQDKVKNFAVSASKKLMQKDLKFYDNIDKSPLKPKKYFYSVSELELYRGCPYKYFLSKEITLKSDNAAAEFGNAVHEFMENPGDSFPFDDEKSQKFLAWFDKYDLKSKQILAKEQNFSWKVGNHFIRGTIDRIDKIGEDTVAIIDYKTANIAHPNKYEFSMNVYVQAFEQIFGKKVKKLELVYPLLDKTFFLEKKQVKGEIIEIIKNIELENFAKCEQSCKICEYKSVCKGDRFVICKKTGEELC